MTKKNFFVIFLALWVAACGKNDNNGPSTQPALSEADNVVRGQWIADRVNTVGDRIILTIDPVNNRAVTIVALRSNGTTMNVSDGTYSISGARITFDLNQMPDFSSSYTVNANQLTLGTEVYLRVTGPLSGTEVSGQVQLSRASGSEFVNVTALSLNLLNSPEDSEDNRRVSSPELLVKYKDGRYEKRVIASQESLTQALTVQSVPDSLSQLSFQKINLYDLSLEETERVKEDLESDPQVEYVVENRLLHIASLANPDDPLIGQQWNLMALDMTDTWGQINDTTPEVYVAVVDTGIVGTHPDLQGRLLLDEGYDFVRQSYGDITNLSLDGDGLDRDPTDPGDHNNLELPGTDSSWHGTHIAGIIAAGIDNHTGIAGIARRVKIIPLRAIGSGGNGTLDDVGQAILYAAKLPNAAECQTTLLSNGGYSINESTCHISETRHKADVINLSLGEAMTADQARPLTEAINRAAAQGIVVVGAAGNAAKGPGWCKNTRTRQYYQSANCLFYPAANTNVISVGALYSNLDFAWSYSNFGNTAIVAPGGSRAQGIVSNVTTVSNNGTGPLYGTSQAAAHVSGVAAMVISELKAAQGASYIMTNTPNTVRDILVGTAIDFGDTGNDSYYGNGLINPCAALYRARGATPSGTGVLRISSETIDFGSRGMTNTILLQTSCGGAPITGITASRQTNNGGDRWMDVYMTSQTTPSRLVFTINRTGLAAGDYSGNVTVRTTGGDRTIQVRMSVLANGSNTDDLGQQVNNYLNGGGGVGGGAGTGGSGGASGVGGSGGTGGSGGRQANVGEMIVLLIDANTNQRRYETSTNQNSNYRFQFLGISPGRYYIVAGIDENRNQRICETEEHEPCMAYPNFTNPEIIEVNTTSRLQNLNLVY